MRITFYSWCPACCTKTLMMTPEAAAEFACVNPETVVDWVDRGIIHAAPVRSGQLGVCKVSLANIAGFLCDAADQTLDPRINRALRLIDERYGEPALSLAILSKALNLSIWRLGRIFKEQTGIGFRAYVRSIRMSRAEELLTDTFLSIKEVAMQVGYKYVSDFDRHFKGDYGARPGEYRVLHQRARSGPYRAAAARNSNK